ncbi:hypothetical protein PINS_up010176 [Pythium insidiosum]|nr:hypothetical protein PINS_up010176 [Pythium insidiosum]
MGVDGVTTAATTAAATASVPLKPQDLHPQQQQQQQPVDDAEADAELLPLGARRTSIPPSYSYGATRSSDVTTPTTDVAERRWRSFDCAGSAKAEKLGELEARIAQEDAQAKRCTERLRPRKRSALFRSLQALFASEKKKEQLRLRQMQMVAEAATRTRSLVVLNDLRTLVLTTDDDDDDDDATDSPQTTSTMTPTPTRSDAARSSFATTIDSSVQRMLDGLGDADQVLADDSLHRILELQTHWLQRALEMHSDKKYDVPRFARRLGRRRTAAVSERVCAPRRPPPRAVRHGRADARAHPLREARDALPAAQAAGQALARPPLPRYHECVCASRRRHARGLHDRARLGLA